MTILMDLIILRTLSLQTSEINQLIASQPTARKAVRLQALLPVKLDSRSGGDVMDKLAVSVNGEHHRIFSEV